MKSGSIELSRMLLALLYLFVYGGHNSRSDEGTDFILNLLGRLNQGQQTDATAEAENDREQGEQNDEEEDGEDDDSDDESELDAYEYEEGPTIFDPYGEEDDEAANQDEEEEYSDGLPRVGNDYDEFDESAESDEDMMDFYEDDMIVNDRANAMDPVLLLAAAKNKLVPTERRGSVRRRDESQHEDENEVNESASPNKKRKLDDAVLDDKFAKSNRNSFNDFLPALIGDGNNSNNNDDDRKRNDQRLNNIFNGESNKSARANKKSNNNSDDDMPALLEDAEDEQQSQATRSVELFNLITRGFNASNTNAPDDDDMPILIESDDEQGRGTQRGRAIVINDDDHDMPDLTSEEEDSDDEYHGPSHSCPVHGPRPTCCPHHAEHGYSSNESDSSEDGEDEENSYWDDEDEDDLSHSENDFNPLMQMFRQQIEHMHHRTGSSNHSSPSTSLRQESPFLRGGASPVAPHHLHSSSNTASRPQSRGRRARAERDSEEYNEDFELDPHRPIDVPPLVWSDSESGFESDDEADVEEISSDSETNDAQIPADPERFRRFVMANLTNAIMSDYFRHEDEDSDDDDSAADYEDEDEDEVVGMPATLPFGCPFTPTASTSQPQAPRINSQGGFAFSSNTVQTSSTSSSIPQGPFQFAPLSWPQFNSNSSNSSNNTTQVQVNINSGSGRSFSFTVPLSNIIINPSNIQTNQSGPSTSAFDPNSVHDVD